MKVTTIKNQSKELFTQIISTISSVSLISHRGGRS
jgi:hypothetical protein